MDFVLSKILGWLLLPSTALLCAVFIFSLPGLESVRLAPTLRILAAGALLAAGVLPIGAWLLHPLESRFDRPAELPAKVDGIIVLGGSLYPALSARFDEASTNEAAERMHAALMLARRWPEAAIVHSGATASLTDDASEADVARRWFAEAGLPADRLVLESRSRNTFENALYSREQVEPADGSTWLLVTSAFHMPRALGVFRALGWPVVPYPVDYRADTGFTPDLAAAPSLRLYQLDTAVRECIGLLYYRLRGWTGSLLPGP